MICVAPEYKRAFIESSDLQLVMYALLCYPWACCSFIADSLELLAHICGIAAMSQEGRIPIDDVEPLHYDITLRPVLAKPALNALVAEVR